MKHIGKLAIIGALFKARQAVFVPCKVTLMLYSIGVADPDLELRGGGGGS